MNSLRRTGGVAAIGLAMLFIALMALLITVAGQGYSPGSGNDPARALAFAGSSALPYVIYALYAATAIALSLIVLALFDQFGDAAAHVMRVAVVAGVIASALFLAYAMIGLVGEPTLVSAYRQDHVIGAAAYLAARVVSNAMNTGAIFATGWAILLSGRAALQTHDLPRPLTYLLMLAGALSVLAVAVPVFSLLAPPLYIGWSLWLGVVLLREPVCVTAPPVHR